MQHDTHPSERPDPRRWAERRAAVEALGLALNPELIKATLELAAPTVDRALWDGVTIVRNHPYGSHERHVLDIFVRDGAPSGLPVLIYVHGGGFVAGAKSAPGSPYYESIGCWAAHHGAVGVTLNYRLAPESRWPGGAEDVAQAVAWVRANIRRFGGDPQRVFLMGQSAGSMHVADYIARPELHGPDGIGLAGGILVSCLYDVGAAEDKAIHRAYYGEDLDLWPHASTLEQIVTTTLPLALAVCEFDEPAFQAQAAQFVRRYSEVHGKYAPMHFLDGQNHLTSVYGIGSDTDVLGPIIDRFMATHS